MKKYIVIVMLAIVFLVSFLQFKNTITKNIKEQNQFKKLENIVSKEALYEDNDSNIFPQYQKLFEENQDFIGWIQIEGTKLNYPVMHTPKDPEYYLHRAFDKSESMSGTPFIGQGSLNSRSDNLLIYGHNMKNGTMFHSLLSYKNKEFWEKYPVIKFNTLYEKEEYVIVSAFYTDVTPENGHFEFYNYINFDTEKEQNRFAKKCKEQSLYETKIDIEKETKFITLVTCSYHSENGRFVVVAKKK